MTDTNLDVTAKGHNADPSYIAKNPELFGFSWTYRGLNKGRDQKTILRDNVPHFVVSDEQFQLFLASFPKVVMASINGTSTVIRGQNVARAFLKHNPRATNEQIQEHLVRSVLLNVITRSGGTRTTYVGADGKTYATLAEAQAASGAADVVAVDVVRLASDFIAEAVDMFGQSAYNVAREKAMQKWPDAFKSNTDDGDPDDETGEDDESQDDDK